MGDPYRHVPQKRLEKGVFGHNQDMLHIGDCVEAVRTVDDTIARGTRLRIANILVNPRREEVRGFSVRLQFDEHPDADFNPKRFRLMKKN